MPKIVDIPVGMTETDLLQLLGEPSKKVKGGRAVVISTQNWSESEYLEKYTESEVRIECWIWKRDEASYIVTLDKRSWKVENVRIKPNAKKVDERKSKTNTTGQDTNIIPNGAGETEIGGGAKREKRPKAALADRVDYDVLILGPFYLILLVVGICLVRFFPDGCSGITGGLFIIAGGMGILNTLARLLL